MKTRMHKETMGSCRGMKMLRTREQGDGGAGGRERERRGGDFGGEM